MAHLHRVIYTFVHSSPVHTYTHTQVFLWFEDVAFWMFYVTFNFRALYAYNVLGVWGAWMKLTFSWMHMNLTSFCMIFWINFPFAIPLRPLTLKETSFIGTSYLTPRCASPKLGLLLLHHCLFILYIDFSFPPYDTTTFFSISQTFPPTLLYVILDPYLRVAVFDAIFRC